MSDASALPGASPSCSTTLDGFPVCVGISQAGGASGGADFLAAFWSEAGGWMEVYSDEQGVWWIEYNLDGSVSIGQEDIDLGSGAQKQKMSAPAAKVPGTYKGSSRPTGTGPMLPAVKPNLTLLKAKAMKTTGSFSSITPLSQSVVMNGTVASRKVNLSVSGGGKCAALMLITKDGKFVSSTGITQMSFPQMRVIELPNEAGTYKIDLKGYNGCMASKASTQLTVNAAPVVAGVVTAVK